MTKNFGHRGFSGSYPENTMLSFRKAIEVGADGVELDVQLSKDGVPVICHDEALDRTTNGHGWLKDYTLAELKELDASYKFPQYRGEDAKIPTLDEFLAFQKEAGFITNIELKTGVFEFPGIEQKVIDLVAKYGLEDKIIYSSFNHYTMLRIKAIKPDAYCGLLSDTWIIDAGAYCAKLGMQAYHPNFHNLIPDVVKELKAHGIEANTWTVNEPEDVVRLASLGIETVIGNEPLRTKQVLADFYAGKIKA